MHFLFERIAERDAHITLVVATISTNWDVNYASHYLNHLFVIKIPLIPLIDARAEASLVTYRFPQPVLLDPVNC